jgi:small subunit ribosomal protein S20
MPILKNAKKALRASKRKAVVNRRVKSRLKTALDSATKNKAAADTNQAYSAVDKAVKKNLIHKNKAARLKSRIAKVTAAAK